MRGNIPDWGGGDYRDIISGADAMVARGIADNDKLAVSGWSYGGYMTSWVVSQTSKFKAALDANAHKAQIDADSKVGDDAGISGTPAFVINGYFVSGAQPFPKFKKLIDRALAEAK